MLNISFKDFVSLFTGVKVIVMEDGIGDAECVDIIQKWSQILGGPRFTGNAEDIINQAGDFYGRIDNTPTNTVQEGDIVVFSSKFNGTVGHVVIATGEGDVMRFKAFSQNDPEGSDCQIREYTYDGPDGLPWVIGWLKKK